MSPPVSPGLAVVRPSATVLAELLLILAGAFPPLDGPLGRADTESVRARRRLADGTPWPVPVTLPIADEPARSVVVEDPEGRPIAVLAVTEIWDDSGTVCAAGSLTPLGGETAPKTETAPATATATETHTSDRPVLAMVLADPPQTADVAALRDAAEGLDAQILLLPMVAGVGPLGIPPHALVRSVQAAVPLLPGRPNVVPVLLPHYADPLQRALACVQVAAAHGASFVLLAGQDIGGADADELPVPVLIDAAAVRCDAGELASALDAGEPLPPDVVPAAVAAELHRARPPRAERGLTVFFTGLSGSGKSTLARVLTDRLREHREVTLLDGDVVRDLLSRGLGFSREDRDLNVRRIGFVAAEVSRHGGLCVAAPIAPYAGSRDAARALVEEAGGGFVLVHVATPLAECERRDVKGLYARARQGTLPTFTGISDPYEEPADADVVVDTAELPVADCLQRILAELSRQGWLIG